MTSRILKQFGAAARTAALVVAGMLVLGSAFRASAQSEQSASVNGLEGTWRVQVTTYNCVTGVAPGPPFSALLAFARGGTLSGTTSSPAFEPGQRTSDYGIWSKTNGNTYKAVSEAFILFASPPCPPPNPFNPSPCPTPNPFNPSPGPAVPGFQRGTQRITQAIEVNNDQFTSFASVQFFDVGGKLLMTGCAKADGQRFK